MTSQLRPFSILAVSTKTAWKNKPANTAKNHLKKSSFRFLNLFSNSFHMQEPYSSKRPASSTKLSKNKNEQDEFSRFVVSASLDGTARAFDILRYRNFRTFAAPKPVQFACVAVDSGGDLVACGAQDLFDVYLFAVQTGRLLEVLSGHEGPVVAMDFSPSVTSTRLVTASWDKTVRVWDAIAKGADHETLEVLADCLCVVFRPDGEEIACATLNGNILIFNVEKATQVRTIEGRNDLGSGVADGDLISAKKSQEAK